LIHNTNLILDFGQVFFFNFLFNPLIRRLLHINRDYVCTGALWLGASLLVRTVILPGLNSEFRANSSLLSILHLFSWSLMYDCVYRDVFFHLVQWCMIVFVGMYLFIFIAFKIMLSFKITWDKLLFSKKPIRYCS
jgi:hypothetical protein